MNLRLERRPATDDAIFGTLFVDGRFDEFTVENAAMAIPLGHYQVVLSVSGRAERGELWTPDLQDHRLPELLDVPGRTGVRIHAANFARQLRGCIAIGQKNGSALEHSQAALASFMAKLRNKVAWIDVLNAPTTSTVNI